MITVVIHVLGKVQGVWFRASAKKEADKIGITGTVKNLNDGSVIIEASGSKDSIESFKKWCDQGPEFANVTEIKSRLIPNKFFDDFKIIRN